MNTTALITPPAAPDRAASANDAGHNAAASASEPTFGEMLAEIVPLVGAVAGYGPPVIFLAGPWLLLALMLSGPFAVLLTLVAAMLVAATLVIALAAVIFAAPYVLIRRLRSVRARRAFSTDRAPQLVSVASTRVAS